MGEKGLYPGGHQISLIAFLLSSYEQIVAFWSSGSTLELKLISLYLPFLSFPIV